VTNEEFAMQNRLMSVVEESTMKSTIPSFDIGDTVDVHVRILEGDKERIQIFNGVVIGRSGSGSREMVIVRRIVQGEGVERKFPLHSPRIADIVVKRSGKVRRAKLYYLRQRSGKAVRLKERFSSTAGSAEAKAAKAERRAARIAKKEAKGKAKAEA
jgi:large subunit ribosomal protein L19